MVLQIETRTEIHIISNTCLYLRRIWGVYTDFSRNVADRRNRQPHLLVFLFTGLYSTFCRTHSSPHRTKKICSGTHYNSYMFTLLCMGYLFCAQLFFDASTSLYRTCQSIVFYSKSTRNTKHCFQATQTAHPIIGEALISQFGQSPL